MTRPRPASPVKKGEADLIAKQLNQVTKYERAPLLKAFSPLQGLIVALVSRNLSYRQIAIQIASTPETVRFHAKKAAKRIPGNGPVQFKILAWARGAPLHVLEGSVPGVSGTETSRLARPILR